MGLLGPLKFGLLGPAGTRPRLLKTGLLKGRTFNVDTASKSMRLVGLDEREITAETRAAAASAVTALDIGANDGWYSLYFASLPAVRAVYAFEPHEPFRTGLLANFALNPPEMRAKLTLVGKLVGDRDDDTFCSVDGMLPDVEQPVVLKIDVDGGEMDVLRGADRTLTHRRCTVVLETHTPDLERDCQAFLADRGYRTRIIRQGWYRRFVPETRDLAHNQWMIAERS